VPRALLAGAVIGLLLGAAGCYLLIQLAPSAHEALVLALVLLLPWGLAFAYLRRTLLAGKPSLGDDRLESR
jgi:hypothetical protein